MSKRPVETMAQCHECLDLFSVEVRRRHGEIDVFAGTAATFDKGTLTHRCGGKANVIWPKSLGPIDGLV